MRIVPEGTTLVTSLGVGSVFDVAIVREASGREVVAKRSRPGGDGSGTKALARESDILGACSTPHLPSSVRAGVDGGGAYLIETLAPGGALRAMVPGAARDGLDRAAWTAIAASTSAALAALHGLSNSAGLLHITHGDVSPDNVFCGPDAQITFVDLSSATWREGRSAVSPHDRGTLPYAAPELARNDGPATQASDTYALAAVLLALAVGAICCADTAASRLFEIGARGLLRQRIDERGDLPPRARQVIFDALAFDAGARLRSSAELAHALALHDGEPKPRAG